MNNHESMAKDPIQAIQSISILHRKSIDQHSQYLKIIASINGRMAIVKMVASKSLADEMILKHARSTFEALFYSANSTWNKSS